MKDKKMKAKAILFDLDGTIFDITERDAFACYEALCQLGYSVSVDEVRQHYRYGIGLMGTVRALGITLTEKETKDYLKARFTSFTNVKNALNLTKIHKGAYNVLSSLSKKYKLILVTSRGTLASRRGTGTVQNKKILCFDCYQRGCRKVSWSRRDTPVSFSRTKLYECVIGLTQIDPEDMVCVGDSLGELEPAKKLQIATIGVLTGISSKEDMENASIFTIQDITQLVGILS
ncbi:MAG: HAD family hydrolase [Candidatus Bathyarchaeia archaeon]